MNAKTDPKPAARPLPADLADVALLDIRDVCAAMRMSASWVHDEVRAGRFPAPVIRESRCTRWRAADVRQHLIAHASNAATDRRPAELVMARARKASAAAQAKRAVRSNERSAGDGSAA